ncbi:MAG: type 4a pilus biogenesis protein PilO [Candidatus Omnitrophica bacterium]|nr:type 4a pilus biogenesis protein PilO [Candidatus Omnitrophota bacterium]
MQKILSKREETILFSTIGMIVFFVFFNFVISPAIDKYEALNKEITITKVKFRKCLSLLNRKSYIESHYRKFSAQAALPSEKGDSLVDVLSELEGFAKEANMRIADMRPQGQRNVDLYKEYMIDIKLEGNIEGFLKFIFNVENSLSLLRIKKFQLSAKQQSGLLEGTFSISKLALNE